MIIEVGYVWVLVVVIIKWVGVLVGVLFWYFEMMGDFMVVMVYEVLCC